MFDINLNGEIIDIIWLIFTVIITVAIFLLSIL